MVAIPTLDELIAQAMGQPAQPPQGGPPLLGLPLAPRRTRREPTAMELAYPRSFGIQPDASPAATPPAPPAPMTLTGDTVQREGPPVGPSPAEFAADLNRMAQTPADGGWRTTVTPAAGAPAAPDADAIVTGATNAAASRTPAATPSGDGMPERGFGDYALAFLSGLSGRGGLNAVRALSEGERTSNATYNALVSRGVPDEMAQAIVLNPQLMQAAAPQIFSPGTLKTVNNRLVRVAPNGQVSLLADFSTGSGAGAAGKPPAGYRWENPADPNSALVAIEGGPATRIPAETAGRIAMMRTARQGVTEARRVYERAWGIGDLGQHAAANVPFVGDVGALSGEVGQAQRAIRAAVESALRAMTGAAAPEEEVTRYMELFTPNARDSVESARQKLNMLDQFMTRAEEIVTQGRGGSTAAPAAGGGWTTVAPGVRIRERR